MVLESQNSDLIQPKTSLGKASGTACSKRLPINESGVKPRNRKMKRIKVLVRAEHGRVRWSYTDDDLRLAIIGRRSSRSCLTALPMVLATGEKCIFRYENAFFKLCQIFAEACQILKGSLLAISKPMVAGCCRQVCVLQHFSLRTYIVCCLQLHPSHGPLLVAAARRFLRKRTAGSPRSSPTEPKSARMAPTTARADCEPGMPISVER